jgi:hypothetical protein
MWRYFVQCYLGALLLFGLGSIVRFTMRRPPLEPEAYELRRGIYIRSLSYGVIGLVGLSLLSLNYVTATITLLGTAVLLILVEYGIVIINKTLSRKAHP